MGISMLLGMIAVLLGPDNSLRALPSGIVFGIAAGFIAPIADDPVTIVDRRLLQG